MDRLTKWFQNQAAKEQRAVFLEDALLSERFAGYAYFRMRYYLGRSLLGAALHITEVVFLSVIFAQPQLAAALLVRTATGFAIAWWWGALEVMREDVRRLRRSQRSFLIARGLSQWFGLSLLCSLFVCVGFGGWIAFEMLGARRPFDVFHFYVLVNGVRLALSLSIRTFHSGVYALRRVYRPLWSLVGVDVVGFWGILLLWPLLGAWSLPSMMLMTFLMSNALTFYFTVPLYRSLALFTGAITPRLPTRAFVRAGAATRRFFLAGCAYALTRVDSVLLFTLAYGIQDQSGGYKLFVLFYVIGPFVRASADWAQLYYFDFKRLELEAFKNFKRTFDKSLTMLSDLAACVCWVLAVVCGTVFLQENLGILYPVLGAFFLVRSRLAFYQIRAFAENRWLALLASGLLILAGGFACRTFVDSALARVEVFIVLLLFALLVLRRSEPSVLVSRSESETMVPLDWIGRLKAGLEPVRVRGLQLSVQVDDWVVEQFAGYLAKRTRKTGAVTLLGGRRIVWWERETARGKLSDDWIWHRGAGMIESFQSTPYQKTGAEALQSAEQELLLGSVNRFQPEGSAGESNLAVIKETFRDMFPEGAVFDAAESDSQELRSFSAADRRAIMYGLVQYSKNFFRILKSGKYDVTALLQQGEIQLIFIVEKAVHKKLRRIWRGMIGAWNLGLALGPVPEEKMQAGRDNGGTDRA